MSRAQAAAFAEAGANDVLPGISGGIDTGGHIVWTAGALAVSIVVIVEGQAMQQRCRMHRSSP